jgi:hypothetical protein
MRSSILFAAATAGTGSLAYTIPANLQAIYNAHKVSALPKFQILSTTNTKSLPTGRNLRYSALREILFRSCLLWRYPKRYILERKQWKL